ncbi:MAG: phosphatase PAP2 family protein [Micrococcaceae bacterium]
MKSIKQRYAIAAMIAVIFAVIFLITVYFFVYTIRGQNWDQAGVVAVRSHANVLYPPLLKFFAVFPISAALITGAILGVYAFFTKRWRQYIACGFMLLSANITTQLFKRFIIERPEYIQTYWYNKVTGQEINSMPSGHTTVAATLVMAVVIMVPIEKRNLVSFLGIFFYTGIATLLFLGNFHRASDVVGAFMVVGFWMVLSLIILAKLSIDLPEDNRWSPFPDIISGVALMIFLLVCLVLSVIIIRADKESMGVQRYNQLVSYDAMSLIFAGGCLLHILTMAALRVLATGKLLPWQTWRPITNHSNSN